MSESYYCSSSALALNLSFHSVAGKVKGKKKGIGEQMLATWEYLGDPWESVVNVLRLWYSHVGSTIFVEPIRFPVNTVMGTTTLVVHVVFGFCLWLGGSSVEDWASLKLKHKSLSGLLCLSYYIWTITSRYFPTLGLSIFPVHTSLPLIKFHVCPNRARKKFQSRLGL